MLPKVLDEMKRKDINFTKLSELTGIPISTLSEIINGHRVNGFIFDKAVLIKHALGSDLPLEELFEEAE